VLLDENASDLALATEAGDATAEDALAARDDVANSRAAFLPGVLDRIQERFDDMIGQRDLTPGVGLLAVGLALVLGASHALLPGHGKTVMAAYIAGRQGSVKDAVTVGATVTATHTGGVLLLGFALTLSTALAGEAVIGWLGVLSGAIVATLGLTLLIGAIRHRGDGLFAHGHTHAIQPAIAAQPALVGATNRSPITAVEHGHDPGHDHDHPHDHHAHGVHDHHDHHDHDHHHHNGQHVSRRGLVGMGIAGGLVPSPSALIILLSAIALGRTWFGIMLVVGYGIGMAATLTAAGILLVKLRDRFQDRADRNPGRTRRYAQRWAMAMPYVTATLVLLVGSGLALRSFADL
jgi:ABC-type nickel/cobalt efflux system permease component RcnA